MNNVYVYLEIEGQTVADVSLELLTKGRKLANQLGCQLEAVAVGSGLDGVEKQVMPYGVDTLHVFDAEGLFPYTSLPHTSVLVNLFKEEKPQICLMGATVIGRDLGPRVSSALFSGLTADCTSLEIGEYEDKKAGKVYENLLYQIRPAFGGNIVATIVNPDNRPQMATVREGVMKKEILDPNYKGEVIRHDGVKGRLRHALRPCQGASRRGRCQPCRRGCRLLRPRSSDWSDRCHRSSQALHCMWYQRTNPAHCRYAGGRYHHLYQQRPECPHQHHCRLRHQWHCGRGGS